MGPPHRSSSRSSHQKNLQTATHDSPLPPVIRPPSKQPNLGMSPASRYQHNLKVLRRRDPSIVSIFDQFSHVCLYHHNGAKWEKQGYEGSMFLYERESYPPYGFYILNRMGMDDHIQRLYPEDTIGAHGDYLIIRSFPEFTTRRVASARASLHQNMGNITLNKFSNVFEIPNVEELSNAQKGDATTIGLWMHATDSREPLIDTFTRLHSFIKNNTPYPDEYRYGPDKPPPAILSSTVTTPSSSSGSFSIPHTPSSASAPQFESRGNFRTRQSSQSDNLSSSELDKLFAKMDPSSTLIPSTTSNTSQQSCLTSDASVESPLPVLGGKDVISFGTYPVHPSFSFPAHPHTIPSTPSTSTGISLLDTIFASAGVSQLSSPASQFQPSAVTQTTQTQRIYSPIPAPTHNASYPQILDQNVISSLLGLPPSRAPSAASISYSVGARSHSSSHEGDNEYNSDSTTSNILFSDGFSESSTVLDPDAMVNEELQSAGASAGRPLLAEHDVLTVNGRERQDYRQNETGKVHGDMTPRAPALSNGFAVLPSRPLRDSEVATIPMDHTTSTSTVTPGTYASYSQSLCPQTTPQVSKTLNGIVERPLVPFEPDSELWPYSRSGTSHIDFDANDSSSDEILELDFTDTSALSNPDTFQRAAAKLNGHIHRRNTNGELRTSSLRSNSTDGDEAQMDKRNRRRKGKKERAADQAREREEIEKSWDPVPTSAGPSNLSFLGVRPLSTVSSSPRSSPDSLRTSRTVLKQRKINGVEEARKCIGPENGKLAEAIKDVLIDAVVERKLDRSLERNDFVREVLTLIHTDATFVDKLYQGYVSKVAP